MNALLQEIQIVAPGVEHQRHLLGFKEPSIFCPLWEQGWVCRMALYWSQVSAVFFAREGGCLSPGKDFLWWLCFSGPSAKGYSVHKDSDNFSSLPFSFSSSYSFPLILFPWAICTRPLYSKVVNIYVKFQNLFPGLRSMRCCYYLCSPCLQLNFCLNKGLWGVPIYSVWKRSSRLHVFAWWVLSLQKTYS